MALALAGTRALSLSVVSPWIASLGLFFSLVRFSVSNTQDQSVCLSGASVAVPVNEWLAQGNNDKCMTDDSDNGWKACPGSRKHVEFPARWTRTSWDIHSDTHIGPNLDPFGQEGRYKESAQRKEDEAGAAMRQSAASNNGLAAGAGPSKGTLALDPRKRGKGKPEGGKKVWRGRACERQCLSGLSARHCVIIVESE